MTTPIYASLVKKHGEPQLPDIPSYSELAQGSFVPDEESTGDEDATGEHTIPQVRAKGSSTQHAAAGDAEDPPIAVLCGRVLTTVQKHEWASPGDVSCRQCRAALKTKGILAADAEQRPVA